MPVNRSFALMALAALLAAGCAGQAAPTITPAPSVTPAPTLDTTALAQAIAADIFAALTAQPTDTPEPTPTASPTPTATLTPTATFMPTATPSATPDALLATVDALSDMLSEQGEAIAAIAAAPHLNQEMLVSTVSAAVYGTLVAQVTQTVEAYATQQMDAQSTQTALENQPASVSVDDDPAIGASTAPVIIIVFSDFSCPHCGSFARETLPAILETYGDDVYFVFRDAPILGEASVKAALAAECADDQDKFWAYHDMLFMNQGQPVTDAALTTYARQLGMNEDVFSACLADQTHYDELANDFRAAREADLRGTPTFFINGRRLVGAQPFAVFQQMIDEELLKAGVLPGTPAPAAVTVTPYSDHDHSDHDHSDHDHSGHDHSGHDHTATPTPAS